MYTLRYAYAHDLSLPCYSPWKDIVALPMINDKYMLEWHNTRKGREETPRNLLATFRGTIKLTSQDGNTIAGQGRTGCESMNSMTRLKLRPSTHERASLAPRLPHIRPIIEGTSPHRNFAWCPPGWATWTPRLFEALLLGCIPALVADHNLLPFSAASSIHKVCGTHF